MMKQRWVYDGLTAEIGYRAGDGIIMYKKITIRYDDVRNRSEEQGIAILDSLIINSEKSSIKLQIVSRTYKVNHKKVFENT